MVFVGIKYLATSIWFDLFFVALIAVGTSCYGISVAKNF
jgi:hypothetical protein